MCISAVAAFKDGVKALFTLGRAVRMATGMKVCWMLASTEVGVGVVCAIGCMVSKSQTVVALGVWSKDQVFLNFEHSAEEGQASGDCLSCCIFARNCKNHGGC